jgi:type I restriction enzyme S subunit
MSPTAALPPYPAYRPSGVEWLGDVPAHWEVQKLKNVAALIVSNVDKISSEEEYPVRLCNYIDVYKNEVISHGLDFMKATASADEIARFRIRTGDVVVTKDSETWIDIGVPALVQYEAPDLICGYHLAIVRPRESSLIGEYVLRAFQSQVIVTQLHVAANGITRYGLSHHDIKDMLLIVPPLPEQRGIAAYLDREMARLDALAGKVRAAIERLREYRAALISATVTGKVDVRGARKR